MNYDLIESPFGIREYALNGTKNRHQFHPTQYVETLKGATDCFQSIYLHSSEIEKYCQAQSTLTGRPGLTGYKKEVSCDTLTLDIDVKDDLERAKRIALGLLYRLEHDFAVDCHLLRIIFSGNKGFHIDIPVVLFGGFLPSAQLPFLHGRIVRQLALGFEDAVDLGIYYTVGLMRVENTRHSSSGLFAIPLSLEELRSLTIDEIKQLAESVREVPEATHQPLKFSQPLVDLKNRCLQELVNKESPSVTAAEAAFSYTACDPKKFQTVCRHCPVLKEIKRKSLAGEVITHPERITLGTVATAFGEEGVRLVHEVLSRQANYDRQKTEYYMQTMALNAYKPTLCNTICGSEKLCEAMKAINKRSPIAFAYTYDAGVDEEVKKYVETYVIERIIRHFSNVIFATLDQSYYKYEGGVYRALSDDDVKATLEDLLPFYLPKHLITNTRLNGLVERLKTMRGIRYEGRFNQDIFTVNLHNGLFNIKTGILEPHRPDYKSNIQLPFAYDAQAACPVFDRFLLDIFDDNKEVAEYLLKYWCYLLLPTYTFQKVLVWIGSGRNGKGTLSRIIQNMIGPQNISYQDLHDLAKNRFAVKNLKDKLVNFSSELKTDDVELGMIKKLSGGDLIAADIKNKDEIVFSNTARLIVMANELPRFSDVGNSVTQRFEFIRFPKEYNDANVDTMLDEKLQAELSGIFNRVIAKLGEIMTKEGGIQFDAPEDIRKQKTLALSDLCNVVEFVETECVRAHHHHCYLGDLHARYQAWAKESGYKSYGKKHFRNILETTMKLKIDNCTRHQHSVCIDGIQVR